MSKNYILYKEIKDPETGHPIFIYIEKMKNLRFSYTERPIRAKRFGILKALLISLTCGFSFVPYKLVKFYE